MLLNHRIRKMQRRQNSDLSPLDLSMDDPCHPIFTQLCICHQDFLLNHHQSQENLQNQQIKYYLPKYPANLFKSLRRSKRRLEYHNLANIHFLANKQKLNLKSPDMPKFSHSNLIHLKRKRRKN